MPRRPILVVLPCVSLLALACAGVAAPDAEAPAVALEAPPAPPAADALPALSLRAGPDAPGDMDQHELDVDLGAGRCRVMDAGEAVVSTLEGRCALQGRDGAWWRVEVDGERLHEVDEAAPVTTPEKRTLELGRAADLPADERAVWVEALAGEGMDDAEVQAAIADGWLLRGVRLYRP